MISFFVISVLFLFIMFMLYEKSDKSICIISSFVYSVGLMFCYNTFIVYFLYLLRINGSFLIFSLINCIIGIIISALIIRGKRIQKYFFDKKKFVLFLVLGIIIFLICFFRFRGFKAISYEIVDSAIHYKQALKFSEELSILDINNSSDKVFGAFVRVFPISYVNCGFIFNIFSNFRPYMVFNGYNAFCFILCSLLFLVTVLDVFKYNKKKYIYALVFSLVYLLAFPLNSFVFGFCYLSLGVMVINLLYLTIIHFKDEFDIRKWFKIIILFLLNFSVFYSYSLFVPFIYLALGIYYILLWRKKDISFRGLLLYGGITLIIPFILGFLYFFVTWFQDDGVMAVSNLIQHEGYCYRNITPIYFYAVFLVYFVYCWCKDKKKDYLNLNLGILCFYIGIFMVLYIFRKSEIYYFYKLFFAFWFFVMLFLGSVIERYKKFLYIGIAFIFIINLYVYLCPNKDLSYFLLRTNIYTWNTRMFVDDKISFEEKEIELMEKSRDYHDICVKNGKFLMVHNGIKRIWYYVITDTMPIVWEPNGDVQILYDYSVSSFKNWENIIDYPCVVYYYENGDIDLDLNKYKVLYENSSGVIVMRNS